MERITRIKYGAGTISVGFRTTDVARHADAILESERLAEFLASIQPGFDLRGVTVTDVVMFKDVVGILGIRFEMYEPGGSLVEPNALMLRGDSVAVLVILETPEGRFIPFVRQSRGGAGGFLPEVPAGMSTAKNRRIQAYHEVLEESRLDEFGLKFTEEDLVPLFGGHRLIVSPGGCNEGMWLFSLTLQCGMDVIHLLNGKQGGNAAEGERTYGYVIKVEQLADLVKAQSERPNMGFDMKSAFVLSLCGLIDP